MYFEDLNLSMTMRLEKITISGQALPKRFLMETHKQQIVYEVNNWGILP